MEMAWVYFYFIFRSAVGLRGNAIAAYNDGDSRDKSSFR